MWTIVIATVAALAAVGIVVDQLFRLREWLNKAAPSRPPDDTDGESPHPVQKT
jgi:hypothetical protein